MDSIFSKMPLEIRIAYQQSCPRKTVSKPSLCARTISVSKLRGGDSKKSQLETCCPRPVQAKEPSQQGGEAVFREPSKQGKANCSHFFKAGSGRWGTCPRL